LHDTDWIWLILRVLDMDISIISQSSIVHLIHLSGSVPRSIGGLQGCCCHSFGKTVWRLFRYVYI
jgi:hypothetical protein